MKNVDKILKYAELFEKLALYGDRSSFLEALAKNDIKNVKNTGNQK